MARLGSVSDSKVRVLPFSVLPILGVFRTAIHTDTQTHRHTHTHTHTHTHRYAHAHTLGFWSSTLDCDLDLNRLRRMNKGLPRMVGVTEAHKAFYLSADV